uniref:Peptidase S1 domain-containing protein n=1 Tax=Panagrellus redivivus TaxID=6233 RepID=A0A7E4V3Z7_PANRE
MQTKKTKSMILKASLFFLTVTCALTYRAYLDDYDSDFDQFAANYDGYQPRIIGGTVQKKHTLPFMAFIVLRIDNETHTTTSNCSGTIISPEHVLTARHCFNFIYEGKPLNLSVALAIAEVRVGSQYKEDRHQQVFDISSYSTLDEKIIYFDLIILKLQGTIKLDGKRTAAVTLKHKLLHEDQTYLVAGFGEHVINNGQKFVDEKSYVIGKVTIAKASRYCHPEQFEVCTFGPNQGTSDGDSGGPILEFKNNKYYQVGMIRGGSLIFNKANTTILHDYGKNLIISPFCAFIEGSTGNKVKCLK